MISIAGEYENEGDDGEGAQSQASPPGVPQPPKGKNIYCDFYTKSQRKRKLIEMFLLST